MNIILTVLTVDNANQIKGRIVTARLCLAKTEGLDSTDFVQRTKIKSRTGSGMVQALSLIHI